MRPTFTLFLYRILLWALTPIIAIYLLREALHRKGGWIYIKQRLGFSYPIFSHKPLWLHAASVGEVNALLPLIALFQQHQPNTLLLVTTNTPTSARVLEQKTNSKISHAYLPADYAFAVKRFLKIIRPHAGLIMETELWPHLFYFSHQQSIPVIIINGRLSHRTLKANQFFLKLYRTALQIPLAILARSEADKFGFLQLGASENRIEIIGNIKFAGTTSTASQQHTELNRPYVLAASTHFDEELQIAKVWQRLEKSNHLLSIAPRHPERASKLAVQLQDAGFNVKRRSLKETPDDKTNIYLIDTYGELQMFIAKAEFVIMGGSFIKHGGQNLLEAAALGKAIITGAHMYNFTQETALLKKENALLQVNNAVELNTALSDLLHKPELRKTLGANAMSVMQLHKDIAERYYQKISDLLKL